jgi:hypothetical protein
MCDTPELPTCSLTVNYPVKMPINCACLTERDKSLSDRPDLLNPCPFAWSSRAKGTFSFSDTFSVTICPLRRTHTSPATAYTFFLVRFNRTVGDETAQILSGNCILYIRETLGIEPDAIDTAF